MTARPAGPAATRDFQLAANTPPAHPHAAGPAEAEAARRTIEQETP
jgi:hypothetical protein